MSKRIASKYKISRRLGVNLWGRAKDPINTRSYPPGQHGVMLRRKKSDFGTQLMEKQKLKGYYGNITEKQFRRIFKEAARLKGDTGENLIGLLESRLDIVVYRLNLVPTVFSARQLVGHGHVLVNGKKVNVPSYRLKVGDEIQIREKSKNIPMVLAAGETQERSVPEYLQVSENEYKGKFLRVPKLMEVPYPVLMEPNLVIEYYSR